MGGYAEAARQSPARPPRLLFYFNGGLNSQALVEQQARRQVPCMIADGYYPVFFVWDTDGLGSYWEQVSAVWDGQVDRSFATRARTPLMVVGNVISGLGQAPADYFIHGRRFFRALRREPRCSLVVREDPDDPQALDERSRRDQQAGQPRKRQSVQRSNLRGFQVLPENIGGAPAGGNAGRVTGR